MKRNSTMYKAVSFVLIVLLSVGLIYGGFQLVESTFLNEESTENEEYVSKTIVKDGIAYFPRQDITTVLFLGIDKFGEIEDSGYYRNDGEMDVITLLIFDEKEESIDILCLNRDTMATIPVIGLGGKEAGSVTAQLALAHTYGSGKEDSGENAKKAVSQLLNNINIDYYISANMNAIEILTDAVGGVEINVEEDFSEVDASISQGLQLLNGNQAISYVRSRQDVGDQLNISRMERQKKFMNAFMTAFQNKLESNDSFLRATYNQIKPYIVSDCSLNNLTLLVDKYEDYTINQMIIPEGENQKGVEYMEYYLDQQSFDNLVIDLFYAQK